MGLCHCIINNQGSSHALVLGIYNTNLLRDCDPIESPTPRLRPTSDTRERAERNTKTSYGSAAILLQAQRQAVAVRCQHGRAGGNRSPTWESRALADSPAAANPDTILGRYRKCITT